MGDEIDAALKARLLAVARDAARHWGREAADISLIKYRENAVFLLKEPSGLTVMRLHRPGYHTEAALASELAFMAALSGEGLGVPSPIAARDGALLVTVDDHAGGSLSADLISHVTGEPIGFSGQVFAHTPERLSVLFTALGRALARLHASADRFVPPDGFVRPAWDRDGLFGEAPLWGRFWEADGLSDVERADLSAIRRDLAARFSEPDIAALDYGLIHADAVRENVLVDGDTIHLIDFDDCGYGHRLFDLATALGRNRSEPHYDVIERALLEGYDIERPLGSARDLLPLFLMARALTYVGWIAGRPEIADGPTRMRRYVDEIRALARGPLT